MAPDRLPFYFERWDHADKLRVLLLLASASAVISRCALDSPIAREVLDDINLAIGEATDIERIDSNAEEHAAAVQ